MKELNVFLKEIFPAIDFEREDQLIGNGVLDSLSMFNLIAALEEEYKISIPFEEILPENFNSMASISSLVNRLEE